MTFNPHAPKPLTELQITTARRDFLSQVERELAIAGQDTQDNLKAMHTISDRINVRAVVDGTEIHYRDADGTHVRVNAARVAADEVVEQVRNAAEMAAHGPDPRVLLAERLVKVGVAPDVAKEYADRWIVRLQDGRVSLIDQHTGNKRTAMQKKDPADEFTAEQWASYRDGSNELTTATREILAAIAEQKKNPPPAPRAVVSSEEHNRTFVANAL